MPLFLILGLLYVASPARAADAVKPEPPATPQCESHDLASDSTEIRCSIRALDHDQRFRLTVTFSGSHDDTRLMMALTLNDEPLVCDAASKIRSMGEDGDVSLTCGFSVAARAAGPVVIRSVVSWDHAEYTGYKVDAR